MKINNKEKNIITNLINKKNAVMISHYYTKPEIQYLTEYTGGFIGDSLSMAKFGQQSNKKILIVCGVKFMGETAKIINPTKTVIMPTLKATCSLDIGCQYDKFKKFIKKNKNKNTEIVTYINTSAKIKTLSNWIVTSSCALDIIKYLKKKNKHIIWAPDKYLGNYIKKHTQANMLIWDGKCVVHEEFKYKGILNLKSQYQNAAVLVHPESPMKVIKIADIVGSTNKLLESTYKLHNDTFIVATDKGIFYKMKQQNPKKKFILAPTSGNGATCQSCGQCPWMNMNNIHNLIYAIQNEKNEIVLNNDIIHKAQKPLKKMLSF